MADVIDPLADRGPVRVYKLVQHLQGTSWSLDCLTRALDRYDSIKGWSWILHDADRGGDHVHLVLWTQVELQLNVLARWFSVPTEQVERVRGGKAGLADELAYMVHCDASSAELGKVPYPDEAMHAVPGWDWRVFLDTMMERRLLAGSSHQRRRTIEQRVNNGMSAREALLAGGSTESRLRQLRAVWLARQTPPNARTTFYVHGNDDRAVETIALGLATSLAGSGTSVFHVGTPFDKYDGERVVLWVNADLFVRDVFDKGVLIDYDMVRSLLGGVHMWELLEPVPRPALVNTKYGQSRLIHEHVILCGKRPLEEVRLGLGRLYSIGQWDGRRIPTSHNPVVDAYAHIPIIVGVSADEIAVQVNEGVLGIGQYDHYRALGSFRMNIMKIMNQTHNLSDDQRRDVESRAIRAQVAPIIEAGSEVHEALLPSLVSDLSLDTLLAEVGKPVESLPDDVDDEHRSGDE